MSQTLNMPNFGALNIVETSSISAVETPIGTTNLATEYSDNFTANGYLYIGRRGAESAEIVQIDSITSPQLIVLKSATTKRHAPSEDLTILYGTQFVIYRAIDPTDHSVPVDSDFAAIHTVDMDFDQADTEYTDPVGGSNYWYKFTNKNPSTGFETALAECRAVRGGGIGDYCAATAIRREAGLDRNRWIPMTTYDDARQAAQQEINSTLSGKYSVPFAEPINPLIREITKKLAAGFVLNADYGVINNTLGTQRGDPKIKEARDMLTRISSGDLVILDPNGTSTQIPNAQTFDAWPNEDTASAPAEQGGGERMFRVTDRY